MTSLSRPTDCRPPANIVKESEPLCLGYARLFCCVKDQKEKLEMVNCFVMRQVIPPPKEAPVANDTALKELCKKRVRKMKVRAHEHFTDLPDNFVTAQQLFDHVKSNGYNCFVVSAPMCLEPERFNSLSFDHIFPLSTRMTRPDYWSIDNLQPMAHCLNHVKANEKDKVELKRWLLQFMLYNYSR